MIKKFGDFNIEQVKDNEREYFERELNARKKMRNEKSDVNDSNLDDIKSFIIKEISEGEDYHITTGKRVIDVDGVKEDEIHIEYDSPQLGRVRIFKPEDTSTKGYYEINGKVFHEDATTIRNFYHFLSLEVVGKEEVPVTENKICNFDDFTNEGFKNILLGTLLFLASCTSVTVRDQMGNKIDPPTQKEIKGIVEKEFTLPSKGTYSQSIKVKGDDGKTYKYSIYDTMLGNKSYKIDKGDSVKMIFDAEGDSKVYKINK
jgi:hypothetical protein